MILLITAICSCTVSQAAEDQASQQQPRLGVCEALSQPLKYDGQFVQIRGRVEGTDEGGWLVGDECPGVFVTDEHHVWPSVISLATPTSTKLGSTRIHPIDFEFDAESDRRIDAKYRELRTRVPDKCIFLTYSGLFETRRDWANAVARFPNGTTKVIGFGHLGTAPAQLILKSADSVEVIPDCRRRQDSKKH
jgi:hypothetical protein